MSPRLRIRLHPPRKTKSNSCCSVDLTTKVVHSSFSEIGTKWAYGVYSSRGVCVRFLALKRKYRLFICRQKTMQSWECNKPEYTLRNPNQAAILQHQTTYCHYPIISSSEEAFGPCSLRKDCPASDLRCANWNFSFGSRAIMKLTKPLHTLQTPSYRRILRFDIVGILVVWNAGYGAHVYVWWWWLVDPWIGSVSLCLITPSGQANRSRLCPLASKIEIFCTNCKKHYENDNHALTYSWNFEILHTLRATNIRQAKSATR